AVSVGAAVSVAVGVAVSVGVGVGVDVGVDVASVDAGDGSVELSPSAETGATANMSKKIINMPERKIALDIFEEALAAPAELQSNPRDVPSSVRDDSL
ncbi:MAG: hypothetical protein IKS74_01975, partial [Methanomicrobium sp.]|nr:hypothetical protein [Methanomicrobium sp.]